MIFLYLRRQFYLRQTSQQTENNNHHTYHEVNLYDEIQEQIPDSHTLDLTQQRARFLPSVGVEITQTSGGNIAPYITLTNERNDYLSPYSVIHDHRTQKKRSNSCNDINTRCIQIKRTSF